MAGAVNDDVTHEREGGAEILTEELERDDAALWHLKAELERLIEERTAELARTQHELERRGAYLEAIMQHIPAGLVIADARTRSITIANEQARTVAGPAFDIGPTEVGGQSAYQAYRLDGSAIAPNETPLARALRGEHVIAERAVVVRPDGTSLLLEVNASPVRDSTGELVAGVALFQDVTASDARRRAASEFIANAAHELRTPLAAIVSGIDVLEGGAKELPEERDRFLAHISREAERLVRLTRSLLLLARVQSGTEAARVEIVKLAPLLAEVGASLRPAAGVKLSIRCGQQTAALANPGLLEQAVANLAGNAVRYTSAGSIAISARKAGNKVRIRVKDSGRGMAPRELERAGERFFRGEASGPGGVGLGLAIAQQAAGAMDGRLRIESELGVGTTVELELPGAQLVKR